MLNYLLVLLFFESITCFPQLQSIHTKKKVHLHLEKFNTHYNLFHIGISFENEEYAIRYDYVPFREQANDKVNFENNKKVSILDKLYQCLLPKKIETRMIYWGETHKTFEEIELFEQTLQKKYILGIHDCRHYVNRFSIWAVNKKTPIWKLNTLWNTYVIRVD
jgi:hypothetical protein